MTSNNICSKDIQKYIVATSDLNSSLYVAIKEIEQRVNDYIQSGYIPIGGISISSCISYSGSFYYSASQAMIRIKQ